MRMHLALALAVCFAGCLGTRPLSQSDVLELQADLAFTDNIAPPPGAPFRAVAWLSQGSYPNCLLESDARGTFEGVAMEKYEGGSGTTSGSCSVFGGCYSGGEVCSPPNFRITDRLSIGSGDLVIEDRSHRIEARFVGLGAVRSITRVSPTGDIHPDERVEFRFEPATDVFESQRMVFVDSVGTHVPFSTVDVSRVGEELRIVATAPPASSWLEFGAGTILYGAKVTIPVERCEGVARCAAASELSFSLGPVTLSP